MKAFFSPNLEPRGRVVRALGGIALLAGAAFAYSASGWLCLGLACGGVFMLVEALRGWCAVRACGIKTLI